MLVPKLISIDTSVFGNLAKDYYSTDPGLAERAKKVQQFLVGRGFIPFFSIHHLEEHLQHKDNDLLEKRFSLIRSFPVVSWIKSRGKSFLPGSILDIQGTEINFLLDGRKTKQEIIKLTKQRLFQYGSGVDFLKDIENDLLEIRDLNFFDTQKNKITDSLVHITDPKISKLKLSEIQDYVAKSPESAEKDLEEHRKLIESKLFKHGDKKLNNISSVSEKFIESVKEFSSTVIHSNGANFLEKLLKANGLTSENINKDSTLGDVEELSVYKTQLDVISKSYGFQTSAALKIPKSEIPSMDVLTKVDKIIRKEQKAHGSNIPDKYLSVFALYIEYSIVDKRISEYFRQIRKKEPNILPKSYKVIKMSDYSQITQLE